MNEKYTVTIPVEEYDMLCRQVGRVESTVEYLKNMGVSDYVKNEVIIRMLGYWEELLCTTKE